jgi:hypothetical protein
MAHTDFGPRIDEENIGDAAVYASHDNYRIWLRSDDNQPQNIALDVATYRALVDYAKRIGMDRLQS